MKVSAFSLLIPIDDALDSDSWPALMLFLTVVVSLALKAESVLLSTETLSIALSQKFSCRRTSPAPVESDFLDIVDFAHGL